MERNDYLIRKKIYKYMLTGVLTTVAIQLGNVVDAMIVGNLIGSMANAAISASTPYLYILQVAFILLGSGGAVVTAILLGRREIENAGKVVAFCMLISVLYPLLFTIASPALVPVFVRYMTRGGELGYMVGQVCRIYSFGMPVISFVMVIGYIMNVDNHPSLSASMQITANVVNLVMDVILVAFTPMGIAGAALSTFIGYAVAGVIFIPMYYRSSKRMIRPVFRGLNNCGGALKDVFDRGMPNLMYLLMMIISITILTGSIGSTLGDARFSAYAVCNNTELIVSMFLNGILSVISAVAGTLYGEKDYYGIRRVVIRVLRIGLLVGAALMLLFWAVPGFIAGLYGFDRPELKAELYDCLRIFACRFPFFVLNSLLQNYYKVIGHTKLSTTDSVLEVLVCKVPFALLGMHLFGLRGVFIGFAVGEIMTFWIITSARIIMQKAGRFPQKGFMAIPERAEGQVMDITIRGDGDSAVRLSEEVITYCRERGASDRTALAIGIAAEELVDNIGTYGYDSPDKKYIDVCLSEADGRIYLRLRDDGIPFNPTAYESQQTLMETPAGKSPAEEALAENVSAEKEDRENKDPETGGLALIRKLALKISYVRVIDLNNTVIEMELTC
jgi:Na+-driven multidrug efflux pump